MVTEKMEKMEKMMMMEKMEKMANGRGREDELKVMMAKMDNANSPGLEIDVRWLCENNRDNCS